MLKKKPSKSIKTTSQKKNKSHNLIPKPPQTKTQQYYHPNLTITLNQLLNHKILTNQTLLIKLLKLKKY